MSYKQDTPHNLDSKNRHLSKQANAIIKIAYNHSNTLIVPIAFRDTDGPAPPADVDMKNKTEKIHLTLV